MMKPTLACLLFVCVACPPGADGEPPARDGKVRTINIVERQGLKLSSDKATYQDGDTMTVTIEVPAEGYLRLYGVGSDGKVTVQLYPNKYQKDDKVAAGALVLPPADGMYDFKLSLDGGQDRTTESVHAVFSPEPFADSGKISYGSTQFPVVGETTAEERGTRGLKPTAVAKSTNAELRYEIAK